MDFSSRLYLASTQTNKNNTAQCPFSINCALALASLGARGNTKQVMENMLSHGNNNIHRTLGELINKQSFSCANALFMSNKATINNAFIADLNQNYENVPARTVDFCTTGRDEVNKWASENTDGNIDEIIPPGGVDATTTFVLTNAVYFKESWVNKFDARQTRKENFYGIGNSPSQVEMMHRTSAREQYGEHGWSIDNTDLYCEFKSLSLLYKGEKENKYRMTFLVSTDENNIESFKNMEKILLHNLSEQSFSDKLIVTSCKYLTQEQKSHMISRIAIPKFTIDSGVIDLKDELQGMGMQVAFSPQDADFTGITSRKPLCITNVFHRVFVKVDEEGTTAAGVTAVSGGRGGSRQSPDVKIFVLDRPFMFLLSHVETNTIVFMGKYMKP
jgi:serpin B